MNKKAVVAILAILLLLATFRILLRQRAEKKDLLDKFQSLQTQYEQAKANGTDTADTEDSARKATQSFDQKDYAQARALLGDAFAALQKAKNPEKYSTPLSGVKAAIVYERLNDARPKRTVEEQIKILKETKTGLIFRASWRWQPQPNSCSNVEPRLRDVCENSGYSFELMEDTIQKIKKEVPGIIIIGAVPAQKINKKEANEETGEKFDESQTSKMALDPAKWGIKSPTKDELQKQLGNLAADGYYPDITNPQYQQLLLSWAKRQIDSGMDGIWIDLLYTQAGTLAKLTNDMNHPAVKESYEAASKIVDDIHQYGDSRGKHVYVGTWTVPMYYSYKKPDLDFVTDTPQPSTISSGKFDDGKWEDTKNKVKETFGDIPILVVIDWGFRGSQLEVFSQELSKEEQARLLRAADDFFTGKGMIFAYPVHGGNMVVTEPQNMIKAYGSYNWYDSLAPEFQTYGTIKELALKKQ